MEEEKKKASTHEKVFGVCENKCLAEVMSKEESNEKFGAIDGKVTETNQKITQTLTDAKAYTDKKTNEVKNTINSTITPQLNNKADKNLGNVANGDFLNKMKANGFTDFDFIDPKVIVHNTNIKVGNPNITVNAGKGIFVMNFNEVIGFNGIKGSVFVDFVISNERANTQIKSEINGASRYLIIDGIHKPIMLLMDSSYNELFYFDRVIPSLNVINYGFKNETSIHVLKLIKIAEFK